MPLRNDGAFYEAALSSFTDSLQPSFIDLRIEVEDLARNQFSYTLEPAFILQQLIPPAISSTDHAIFVIGRYGSFSFTATGHPKPQISIAGQLPEGLVFDESTATIHGSPSPGTAGVYPLTVTARNNVDPDAVQNFTLTVNAPPAISSADRAIFVIGRYGSFSFTATGHPKPQISIAGQLPEGLVFDESTATIHGSPSPGTAGVYPLTVTARNNVDPDAVQNFTLTVNAPIFLPLVIR